MNKLVYSVIVALFVGGIVGYAARGSSSAPKPESQPQEDTVSQKEEEYQAESKEWKMQNAMSAAPESISKDATILDWPEKEGGDLSELKKGTNDWTCLPDSPSSPGNDPICADKQGVLWFQAYMTQKSPNLTQVGLAYMLQGGSDASNTDPFATKPAEGEGWLTAPAHVMVFPVGKLDPAVYGTDHKKGGSWIMRAGTPYEHLMIPVK